MKIWKNTQYISSKIGARAQFPVNNSPSPFQPQRKLCEICLRAVVHTIPPPQTEKGLGS